MTRLALLAFALAGALAPAALAAAPALPRPVPGAPKPYTLPATETYTLANGMSVTLAPSGLAPKTTVRLYIRSGNLNEGEDTWLADLAGEMLREGAAGKSSAAIAEAAAMMGGQLDINVSAESTRIGTEALAERTPDAIALIADVARRPDFPAAEFDRVRGNLLRDLAVSKSRPQPLADAALMEAHYGAGHPFGRLFPTEAQLKGYTRDQAKAFHDANVGAARARLYVAGRFDGAAVKKAVEAAFGDWAAGPAALAKPAEPRPGPRLVLVNRPDAAQSTVRLAFPAPPAGDARDIPLRVMNALLGDAFTSRLVQNLREDKGYTYSPGSEIVRHAGEAYWVFEADITTDATAAALAETFKEIRRLQAETPSAEEAAGMRNYSAGVFVLRSASTGGLVNQLAERDFHALPADWLDRYVARALGVSAEAMSETAREVLPLGALTLVVVGDLAKVRAAIEALPELKGVVAEVKTFE